MLPARVLQKYLCPTTIESCASESTRDGETEGKTELVYECEYTGYIGEGAGISQSRVTTSSYSKEEEEERLRELMRDDFIDDLKSGDSIPVQLPMITTGLLNV